MQSHAADLRICRGPIPLTALPRGRRFNDATLPTGQHPPLPSTLPFQDPAKSNFPVLSKPPPSAVAGAASLEEQLRAASASPSVSVQPRLPVDASAQSGANDVSRPSSTAPIVSTPSNAAPPVTEEMARKKIKVEAQPSATNQLSDTKTDHGSRAASGAARESPSMDPQDVNSVNAGDKDSATSPTSEENTKAPQVVHLPPRETQEARLNATEHKLEKAAEKERKEEERLAIPSTNGPADIISSPSSTIGPYSQATPHAPHHSPDTSPDTEHFHDRGHALASNEDSLDPAAQQVKEDHERALRKQMKEARERARGHESPASDVEKQIEDEQAIRLARDGKGRLNGRNTSSGSASMTQTSEQVAREQLREHGADIEPKTEPAADSLPTPTTTAPEPSVPDHDSADVASTKLKDDSIVPQEHPTPPADADLDMADAPTLAGHEKQNPSSHDDNTTTQASAGATRQKSASEIIGEHVMPRAALTPRSSNISTSVSPQRLKDQDQKSKEVSTVVFAKKSPARGAKAMQAYNEDYASLQGASEDSSRDYLEGLFKYQAHHPPRSVPLEELVASARKTVSTAGTLSMIRERQDYKILKRVYQLQNANRWSLRQLQKSIEPERPFTHQDQMLLEMKWMQTDFKEERKWKKALAATFAGWCAEYVNASPEEQSALRIEARIPDSTRPTTDDDMNDAPTPDLVHSGANETESESLPDEDELLSPFNAVPPASVFSLGFNDVVMKIQRTSASDSMFRELPYYEPTLEGSSDATPFPLCDPHILPVSKFVTGKLVSQITGPPRKRSRYDYDSEDEPSTPPSRAGTSAEHSMPSTPGRRLFCRNDLPPEMTDVALFNAENKHVRDRLQAAHQFRPPTEFNMPSVAFFENRTPSQWLWEEDQKLRALVKEYTFNWSLVSQQLTLPSLFVSGSGRRTPWECFERWVQLEGLPAEMSKTQYFRTYQARLEQANKVVFAQFQAQQQQQQQQGQAPGQPRRRPTTTPIRVERRRENRHLAIIDAMRKLARKRESAAHKQAESQKAAALRKAQEPQQSKTPHRTPQEFSRMKWEREESMKQRQMQQEMHMRVRGVATSHTTRLTWFSSKWQHSVKPSLMPKQEQLTASTKCSVTERQPVILGLPIKWPTALRSRPRTQQPWRHGRTKASRECKPTSLTETWAACPWAPQVFPRRRCRATCRTPNGWDLRIRCVWLCNEANSRTPTSSSSSISNSSR